MNFITPNWLFIVVVIAFLGTNFLGHGGCGGHGNHAPAGQQREPDNVNVAAGGDGAPAKHRHAGCH